MAQAYPPGPELTYPFLPAGMDPEKERPRNFEEGVSGDDTWDRFGLRIKWTEPIVPGDSDLKLDEPLRLRLCLETKKDLQVPPEDISAWCWTHIIFESNPYGIWKEIKMQYNPKCTQWDDHGVTSYVFQSAVQPVRNEHYRLTFNVKWKNIMVWANFFRIDNILDVKPKPSVGTQTTIFPPVHFTSNFTEGWDGCSKIVRSNSARHTTEQKRTSEGRQLQFQKDEDLEMLVVL